MSDRMSASARPHRPDLSPRTILRAAMAACRHPYVWACSEDLKRCICRSRRRVGLYEFSSAAPRRRSSLIGHDHPRRILQAIPKAPEAALGRATIAPILNKNVEDNAMLIDGTPELVLCSLDSDRLRPCATCLSAVASGSLGDWRKPRRIFCTIAVLSHKRRQGPAQPKSARRHTS
jgi:hypothetical protein